MGMLRRPSRFACLLVAACLSAPACGPKRTPTLGVSGTVRLVGKPVEGAAVTFFPSRGRPANGFTDAEGRFTVRTWTEADGAIEGDHVVCVTKQVPDPEGKPGPGYLGMKNLLPERYGSPTTTPLRASVSRGGANEFVFDLE